MLAAPVAKLTPASPRSACTSSGSWELSWTLAEYPSSFTVYRSGVLFLAGYIREPAPKGLYKFSALVSKNSNNTTFAVSYSDRNWTATSAAVRCTNS